MSLASSIAAATPSGSNPLTIFGSDLVFWGSPQYELANGIAHNAQLVTFRDLSGLGNNLVGTVDGTNGSKMDSGNGPAGGASILLPGASSNQAWAAQAALFDALETANEGHIYIYLKSNLGAGSLHGWSKMKAASASNQHYGADANWQMAENWGSANRYSVARPQDGGGTTLPLNVWRLLDISSVAATGGYVIKIDNNVQTHTIVNGSEPNDPAFKELFLGNYYASLGEGYQPFNGRMGAVIIAKKKATAPQDTLMRAFLAANPSGGLP